jgi:tetratricopeptide (TPR) repeat protein
MRKVLKNPVRLAALLIAVLAQPLLCGTALAADAPAGPTVTAKLAKPLKAAQDAMTAKNWDAAMAAIKEAQAMPVEKSAYDNFIMNAWLSVIYSQKQDIANEIVALQSNAQSQYATPDQQKNWLRAIVGLYQVQKDYPKVVESGELALKHAPNDPDIYKSIADADNRMGKYKEAAAAVQQVIEHQEKPEENLLAFQWNCYSKVNDDADAAKVIDKLVTYYPKPDYWQNAVASLQQKDIKDEHLRLDIYRLMSAVGVLKRPFDYGEMAEIALDLGYPGESQAVLEQALAANVFTNQGDKDRNEHLLIGAKQRAATDQGSLAAAERDADKATSGDQLVQVGVAYMTYGQLDKAVADISKGIAKGMLKNTDEALLELGMAQLKAKNTAEAVRSFEKVAGSSAPDYGRLGKLWALHAGAHGA